jgi:tRNA-2-methylthio-N6-dimethylallyladenosine synthase
MNERDSEALAALLTLDGYEVVEDEALADAILLNTCAVREAAEVKAIGKARHLLEHREKTPQLKVGILGCMAQNRGRGLLKNLPGLDLIVGTQQIHHIPEMLDHLFAERDSGRALVELAGEEGSQNAIAAHTPGKKPCAFVSIMQGCNMRCAYCIVPKTRGRERCRPVADIVAECRALAESGTREVTLLGQIVTSYGRREMPVIGGKSPFVQLLEAVAEIPGIERIRFTSPHPRGFRRDLAEAFRAIPKLMPSVHLPVQSGSDRILKEMNRPYTAEKYLEIVAMLRETVPEICISTDAIVGFPGETEEDFCATAEMFETVRFDMAYVFKYSPRPGAPLDAAADDVPEAVKETRCNTLLDIMGRHSLARNQSYVGKVEPVLVEGPARRGEGRLMGHNPGARKVVFSGNAALVGQIVPVRIDSATVTTLEGSLQLPLPSQI